MLQHGDAALRLLPHTLASLLLAGCATQSGDKKTGLITNEQGTATLEVDLNAEESAMLITVEGDAFLAVDSITDPSGETVFHWNDWYSLNTYLTAAVWPLDKDLVLNWPVRAEDAPLTAGTWEVTFAAVNDDGVYQMGKRLTARTQTKADDDWGSGEIKVVIAFAEGIDEDPVVVGAVEAAVTRWEEVWAPYGLVPVVRYAKADIDAGLPYVGDSTDEVDELSSQTDADEILMIVGETISAEELYYGVSGNIPGSLLDTPRSAVAISWLANTGLDGEFSTSDIRLMGETMAHETSHYMGLFHPVETSFDVWDAVRDTEDCNYQESCEADLGDNLMYPYPVCNAFSCIPQDALTDIQAGILHRYTGTQ